MSVNEQGSAALLVINDSIFLKRISQITHSVSVICIESISSELSHFTLGHLFSLLNLLRIQLNLRWIYGTTAPTVDFRSINFIVRVYITVIVVLFWWRSILIACSILLSNSILKLIDCTFLQFLSHYLFFSEPSVFGLPIFINIHTCWIVSAVIVHWSLWMTAFCFIRVSMPASLMMRCCHVKHCVIKFIIFFFSLSWGGSTPDTTSRTEFRIFRMHINVLIFSNGHVFLGEITYCLTETNLIIETRWSNKGAWWTVHVWLFNGWLVLFVRGFSLIELSNFYLFNVFISATF